jgi:hypothetical protein
LEKLYKERWGSEDGVGSIIISPTRELAGQLFDVLKTVGKFHNFSAGLLIGGRKEVEMEKEHVNVLSILVCTPGRLLQHMDETPNFDCSQLQVNMTVFFSFFFFFFFLLVIFLYFHFQNMDITRDCAYPQCLIKRLLF